jgi:hypothetical protein
MRDKRIQKVWRRKFIQVVRELNQVLEEGPNLREVDVIKSWD